MNHSLAKIKSRKQARRDGQIDYLLKEPGAAVKNQTIAKHLTYALLIAIAKKQFLYKKKTCPPTIHRSCDIFLGGIWRGNG